MPRFRISEGFNKHVEHGRISLLARNSISTDQARELKRCALVLGKKVRLADLSFARLEAAAADRSSMRDAALADQKAQPEELRDPPPASAAMQLPPEPTPERHGPGRPPKSPPPSPPFRAGPPATRRP